MFDQTKASDLTDNPEKSGTYICSACNNALFDASKKFDAGCGFPSFWQHANNGVKFKLLNTYNRTRTQLLCGRCDAHLGHLFPHKHTPSGRRYCINHDAIRFESGN